MIFLEEDKAIEVRSEIIRTRLGDKDPPHPGFVERWLYGLIRWRTRKFRTVLLIEMPRFYVGKLLLHHYKSDLAHTSD